jgi:hypothetical protein
MNEEWPPPTDKSEAIQKAASAILGREDNVYDRADCVFCDARDLNPGDFRDALSRREFGLSRTCQAGQARLFGHE